MEDPEGAIDKILKQAKADHDAKINNLKERFPDLSDVEKGLIDGVAAWAEPEMDISDWAEIEVTEAWENQGFEGFDGYAWYRTTFTLTETEAANEATLSLGMIDDNEITWVNGVEVGSTNGWNIERSYTIAPHLLKAGVNTIAIRVEDTYGGGGMHGASELLFVKTQTQKIALPTHWKIKLDAVITSDYLQRANQVPTLLYNKMIYPILNYGITGALWYQGESNGSNATDAEKYADLFQDMISSWRSDFRSGEFPFLYVQLANFLAPKEAGAPTNWAILRASQTEALQLNNTAQAVIIDIGEADDIHPRNKQDVGLRLSLAARKLAYGEDIIYQSPMYTSYEIIDDKVHISFDHVGEGLEVHDRYQYIKGFAIAGADEKFSWAKARLDGHNKVVVWNERIESPKYVIYAWADNPDDVNLYNSANLPATPFRLGY